VVDSVHAQRRHRPAVGVGGDEKVVASRLVDIANGARLRRQLRNTGARCPDIRQMRYIVNVLRAWSRC
jgi:hypothetical protein